VGYPLGSIELRVPRVRDGGYYPTLLEPRRRGERALVAVVQEAYVQGVSTRRVDDLVKALGMSGISKSQISRVCQALDTEVERFRTRKLDGPYPFCWLDATFLKVRHDYRVVSMAVVIAVGVNSDGQREVLGVDDGPSEDGAFWLTFLRSLIARGLSGVQLVTSDSHQGLKSAIVAVRRVEPVREAASGDQTEQLDGEVRLVDVGAVRDERRLLDAVRAEPPHAARLNRRSARKRPKINSPLTNSAAHVLEWLTMTPPRKL